jgi:hypothetical protein
MKVFYRFMTIFERFKTVILLDTVKNGHANGQVRWKVGNIHAKNDQRLKT